MGNSAYFIWLLNASFGLLLLSVCYRLLLGKLTLFVWNRWFLLIGVLLCLVVPVLPFHFILPDLVNVGPATGQAFGPFKLGNVNRLFIGAHPTNEAFDWPGTISAGLLGIYVSGIVYKSGALLNSIRFLVRLKMTAFKLDGTTSSQIYLQRKLPTFSFAKHIFLHEDTANLTALEMEQVLSHETVHVKQQHTIDVLFYELVMIPFWFHPLCSYLKRSLKEVHEFLADDYVTGNTNTQAEYGKLLVKLATQQSFSSLVHTFSQSQLYNRLNMLTTPRSSAYQKLRFLAVIPALAAVVLFSSSFESRVTENSKKTSMSTNRSGNTLTINKIIWNGNTKHTDKELTDLFLIKAGDVFDSVQVEKAVAGGGGVKDFASLYMDEGYLFFRVDVRPVITGKYVDLNMDVNEGKQAKIGKISIRGNKKVSENEILNLITMKPGDLFNRTAIINSQRKLSESGLFNPKHININPIPDQASFDTGEMGVVDWVFEVTEL